MLSRERFQTLLVSFIAEETIHHVTHLITFFSQFSFIVCNLFSSWTTLFCPYSCTPPLPRVRFNGVRAANGLKVQQAVISKLQSPMYRLNVFFFFLKPLVFRLWCYTSELLWFIDDMCSCSSSRINTFLWTITIGTGLGYATMSVMLNIVATARCDTSDGYPTQLMSVPGPKRNYPNAYYAKNPVQSTVVDARFTKVFNSDKTSAANQ